MRSPDNLTHKDVQSLDAAKLYYSGLSQSEVAEKMHLSRPTISKLLQHATSQGFVRITIHDPRNADTELEDRLVEKFGLSDARVVYPASVEAEQVRLSLGKVAAELLGSLVAEGDIVGVSWSRTIEAVSKSLGHYPKKGVEVVQIRGGIGAAANNFSEVATINRFAKAFDAKPYMLPLPTIFESVQGKTAVERERQVVEVMEKARSARFAVFTVGDATSESFLLDLPAISKSEREYLIENACGDICSRFVDCNGRICLPDLNNRTISISLPHLRKIPQRILVVGGVQKAEITRVALENGYVSHLVIDSTAAEAVLAQA